ncbi:MAG: hypothetical protein ACOYJQ_05385 [Pseudochelatococcus sp.]|jgi:hypothetical protein|uniref:hypothetical protein n=1 Tax=Pseudochelatococcus sp. TaxID=2020869 RepID=UPI003D8DDB29
MFRGLFMGGAFALAFLTSAVDFAFANASVTATDGVITIPWGAWLAAVLDWASAIVIAVIAWALRRLPAGIHAIIRQLRAEQLLGRAVDYGINAVKGATRGKKLDIVTTHAVIETAAEYAVANAPVLVGRLGADTLRAKILARIEADESVTAADVGAGVPPPQSAYRASL